MAKQNLDVVLIDDLRSFKPEIASGLSVRTLRDPALAALWIRNFEGHIYQLWLDHDMGESLYGVPMTVIPVIRELVANQRVSVSTIVIHTDNKVAVARIKGALGELESKSVVLNASEYLEYRLEESTK